MPTIALIAATLLVIVGSISYANGTPNVETGKVSPTALIPAFIGIVLGLCGIVGFSAGLRKHAMHLAAMVGLFGAVGGIMPLVRAAGKPGGIDPTAPAVLSGILTILICSAFVALCVKSFIDARKARKAAAAVEAPVT